MAFDEALAERIRQRLARRKNVEEKKLFGGVGFPWLSRSRCWCDCYFSSTGASASSLHCSHPRTNTLTFG